MVGRYLTLGAHAERTCLLFYAIVSVYYDDDMNRNYIVGDIT